MESKTNLSKLLKKYRPDDYDTQEMNILNSIIRTCLILDPRKRPSAATILNALNKFNNSETNEKNDS